MPFARILTALPSRWLNPETVSTARDQVVSGVARSDAGTRAMGFPFTTVVEVYVVMTIRVTATPATQTVIPLPTSPALKLAALAVTVIKSEVVQPAAVESVTVVAAALIPLYVSEQSRKYPSKR